MRILRWYVLRELIGPILISGLFFSFLLMLRQLFTFAELFLEAGVGINIFFEFLGIVCVTLLIITVPMAALLGSMVGIGRMTSENEILAMRVAGFSLQRIFFPVFLFAALGSLGLMYCGFEVLPSMLEKLADKEEKLKFEVITNLAPGRNYQVDVKDGADIDLFYENRLPLEPGDGPYTLRMKHVALHLEGGARDIVHQGKKEKKKNAVIQDGQSINKTMIFADQGIIRGNLDDREIIIDLIDGTLIPVSFSSIRNRSEDKESRFRTDLGEETTLKFASLSRTIKPKTEDKKLANDIDPRQLNFLQLREVLRVPPDQDPQDPMAWDSEAKSPPKRWRYYLNCRNEMYQRLSLPWSLLAFVLIAVPLAVELRPRAKSISFILSILMIMLYYVVITSAGALGMSNSPYTLLAYLSPNFLLGGIGLFLFWRVQR